MALKPSEIQVSLQITAKDPALPVRVVFRNTSPEKAYLYKRLVPAAGRLKMNLFRISGPNGSLRYRGLSVKLAAPTLADFIEMAPGATIEGTNNIGENYAFPPGGGTYHVRYLAANCFPQGSELRKIESPEVTVELPA